MNKRNRYILYIVISVICVIAIIIAVYNQVFNTGTKENNTMNEVSNNQDIDETIDLEAIKDEFNSLFNNNFNDQGYDTSLIEKIQNLEEQDVVYAAYNIKEEKDESYSVNINIPVFNVQGEVANEFNKITQSVFANKANDVLSKVGTYTIYNVEYVAYLNENILSLVIKSTLKEGDNPQRIIVQTYNYDILTKQEVTLNELLDSRGIEYKEVNKEIEKNVKEATKQAEAITEALANSGQTVYKRDINNAMYVTDNVANFFVGLDGQIYIVYAYGNTNYTSEIDIIKI